MLNHTEAPVSLHGPFYITQSVVMVSQSERFVKIRAFSLSHGSEIVTPPLHEEAAQGG